MTYLAIDIAEEYIYWRGMAAQSGFVSDTRRQYQAWHALEHECYLLDIDPEAVVALVKARERRTFALTDAAIRQVCRA